VRPDGKIQVTMEIKEVDGRIIPQRVHTVLISTQHEDGVSNEQIASDLIKQVIEPIVPAKYIDKDTKYVMNPSGRFVIGGPHGDAGLTGRKIIVDTYGGWGAHGGGAFSGKVRFFLFFIWVFFLGKFSTSSVHQQDPLSRYSRTRDPPFFYSRLCFNLDMIAVL
jgi:hypothetical protein